MSGCHANIRKVIRIYCHGHAGVRENRGLIVWLQGHHYLDAKNG